MASPNEQLLKATVHQLFVDSAILLWKMKIGGPSEGHSHVLNHISVIPIIMKARTRAAYITAVDTEMIKHGRQLCKIEDTMKISSVTILM